MEQKEQEEKSQAEHDISSEGDPISEFERDFLREFNQEDSAQRGSPSCG